MSYAQGIHGSGSRDFTDGDQARVMAALSPTTYQTVMQLATATGLEGRTVRAVLSELDGQTFVLAGGDEGYKIAATWEEAEGLTRRLESQARKMAARANRRREAISRLGVEREQGHLFL